MRRERFWRFPALGLVLLLAACTAASPTSTAAPSALGSAGPEPSPAAIATPTSAPTPTPPPRPSGTLLVWQLDGTDGATARTESLYRLDLTNGATAPVATIPVDEDTCCPSSLTFSGDRRTAFLHAGNYRGALDVATGTFEKASARIPRGTVAISHSGDRLAWVDDVTGTGESIAIVGLRGEQLQRITLPPGAFASVPMWSNNDETLLVTTMLPVKTGSSIRLASAIACCSIDRGVQATHLLVVPLDGSAIRDIYDDRAGVTADQAQPPATPPPGTTGGYALPASHTFRVLAQSPDGRTLVAAEDVCQGRWGRLHDGALACTSELLTIDTGTGQRTSLAVPLTNVSSAAWSPDGRRLSLLGSAGGGPTGLYVMDRTGGDLIDLGPAEPDLLAWSTDGAWIAFWRLDPAMKEGDRVQVWVASSTGGDARFVAAHATAGWLEP